MPEVTTSKVSKGQDLSHLLEPEKKYEHNHPHGVRDEVVGIDEQGRRMIRQVSDRVPTYVHSCKACMQEDRARMQAAPTLTEDDMNRTMFLVPESDYDQKVCRAYIANRYPEAKSIVSQFHAERMSYVKGAQIVVVTRRALPGRLLGSGYKRMQDEETKGWFDMPVPPETHLHEVVESPAIVVSECMLVKPADMFSEQSIDMTELVARLAERAHPYRIALPADERDRMFVMRLNS